MTGILVPHTRPYARAGQVIGLLGGSFDPPHAGHLHISREALRRFALDGLWWMISPGNPLKEQGPAPMPERIAAARRLIGHAPRIRVTGIEAQLGTRYTAQTLAHLRGLYPGVRFVWLMGADNLAQLHRWQDWRQIMEGVPVGVLARPGARQAALNSPAARIYRGARVPAAAAWTLGHCAAPAWCFVNAPMVALSSTGLRARREWPRGGVC